ncbi:hypothetical protein MKX03_007556 [Papaver bracteatum]|nr:hypothetical protein MKX03_007556 [Papaver bracteatum]
MARRILNQAMSKIVNAERRSRSTATLQPISGLMSSFLNVMKHRDMPSVWGFVIDLVLWNE